jgi:chemotaxis protein methyltransferase CheR
MNPLDYEYLRKLLKARSGLVLSADKHYLVENRLLPVAREHGLGGLEELVERMRRPGADILTTQVVEAMATNESFFMRDKIPFDHFRDTIIPSLLKARNPRKRIRIWSAGCATGQEPYSLAMILHDMQAKLQGWQVDLLATDFSGEVLERARSGSYSQFEVQRGLPIQLLVKHFVKQGERWDLHQNIRRMVEFREINLLNPFNHLGRFDVIFCRNVLIYFDRPTKADVLDRLARITEPDGYLVLGGMETVVGVSSAWKPMVDKRGLSQPVPRISYEGQSKLRPQPHWPAPAAARN